MINEISVDENRYRELRSWLCDRLRATESKHESIRDNHIDESLVESFRARKILDAWSLNALNSDDHYVITGLHEELSWIQKQFDFLRIEEKEVVNQLHPNQTKLIG